MGSSKESGAGADDAYVVPAQLRVGMHVHLDLSWMDHPFPQSSFKIKSEDQIATIRSLGLRRLRWTPKLSDVAVVEPGPESEATPAVTTLDQAALPPSHEVAEPAQVQALRMAAEREAAKQCQRALREGAKRVREISRSLHANPAQAFEQGQALVQEVVGGLLEQADVAIRVMADGAGNESAYHHALNVTLLALMLSKVLALPRPVMDVIGLGALFHDIGKFELPDRITRATGSLTRSETSLLQTHAAQGIALARKMGVAPEVEKIIAQHHELADGSGYPAKLKGTAIFLPARLVTVVNTYDNLVNPLDVRAALTPHEALALMWGRRRSQFDEKVLGAFVRSMGVYPPGCAVRLSDDRLAAVVTVNSGHPLKPWVMVFDPTIPRERAPLLDLQEEAALSIVKAVRPQDLPPLAREALSLGTRMAYHVGGQAKG